jgi:nucleolar protein 14
MMVSYYKIFLTLGDIKEYVVRQTHFGGNFDDQSDTENPTEERPKTKSQVMQELISKSKMYKHERQQQQQEDLEDIDALDAELGELQGLLRTIQPTRQERPQKTQEMLSYDAALREMVYDKRSKPTERVKTDEEIAQEEMERLQKLEEERLKRMRGEEPEEAGGHNQWVRREGDDLDDDFVPDEGDEDYYGLGKGAAADESDDEGSIEEPAEDDEMKDDESEDEDEEMEDDFDLTQYFTDEEDNDVQESQDSEEGTIVPATKRLRIGDSTSTSKELAYTFPCPSTFDEMLDIINDVPMSSVPTVIERIEILYSTKLLAENRQKLEVRSPLDNRLI